MEMVRFTAGSLQPNSYIADAEDVAVPSSSATLNRSDAPTENSDATDSVVKDAASILEFLAWGRNMHPDYNTHLSPEASAHEKAGDLGDAQPSVPDMLDEESQVGRLQLLLPGRRQMWELVRYHEECLLWYHCSYFPPSFHKQMDVFFDRFQGVIESGVNLQWLALLFAVLTGSKKV